ncbi:MAG: glycosyltransferase [Acidobacteriaceae bacterium]|nr:glycosyltransferase [Acidobacteriaceae bacterium]
MTRARVMHVLDSLAVGGAEQVAVNLVNALPQRRYVPYLCTTRQGGPLLAKVGLHVSYVELNRRAKLDPGPLLRLARFVHEQDIRILHAHGTSLFVAGLACCGRARTKLVWHIHSGEWAASPRVSLYYRTAARKAAAVIAVNRDLCRWATSCIGIAPDRVHYLRNFPVSQGAQPVSELPGEPGFRVICVANLRPEKDHATLMRAFALVVEKIPRAHLLLIGSRSNRAYCEEIDALVRHLKLGSAVSFLGSRSDVPALLGACDVGVLSSRSEGLPLALLEYGSAGLACVVTRTGQCSEVVANGSAGILVEPRTPAALAGALVGLLESPSMRRSVAAAFRSHVEQNYSCRTTVDHLCRIYDGLLAPADETVVPSVASRAI